MHDLPASTVNKELLFWSSTVVVELFVITALTGAVWVVLGIIPMFWWPIRDALNWPVPREPAAPVEPAPSPTPPPPAP